MPERFLTGGSSGYRPCVDVEPLDPTEMAAWRAFVEAGIRILDQLDRELQHDSGLSAADYEILVHLSEAPERRMLMTELAEASLVSQSRLTYRIDRLEGEDLVERKPCEADGRRIWAALTPVGLARLEGAYPAHLAGVRRYVIDPVARRDLPTLARALEAMAAALTEARRA